MSVSTLSISLPPWLWKGYENIVGKREKRSNLLATKLLMLLTWRTFSDIFFFFSRHLAAARRFCSFLLSFFLRSSAVNSCKCNIESFYSSPDKKI